MNNNISRLVGHIGFLVLIVLGAVIANERVIYIDSAAQLFEMIQRDWFVIYDHRYTMVVTQLLPLLFIKLRLPLQAIIVAYSVAAPLLAYIAYLLITYVLRDVKLGLALLLPVLCMRHTFFHAISESFSLMIYAILLAALLLHRPKSTTAFGKRLLHIVGVVLSAAAAVFIHPIGMFFVLFLVGYFLVGSRFRPNVPLLVTLVVLVACVYIRSRSVSGHDSDYMPTAADVLYCFEHPADLKVLVGFLRRLADLYIYPIVLYVAVLVHHIRHRQWVRMAYGLLFNVCFILMTVIVYRWDSSAVCVERAWMPLIFFSAVPFMCEVVPALSPRGKQIWFMLMTVFLLIGYVKIVDTSKHYRQRKAKIEQITDLANDKGMHKMVVDRSDIVGVFDVDSWCNSFESILISALQGPERTINIYVEEDPLQVDNPDYAVTDAFLAVPWWRLWGYETLRPRWFSLPEQPFVRLTFHDGEPVIESLVSD
ncbi:MAG: hypothetical protein IK058_05495 [Bacteroidales bacterium]|nr:hypothetical protein [Bacteroidales bacterium]